MECQPGGFRPCYAWGHLSTTVGNIPLFPWKLRECLAPKIVSHSAWDSTVGNFSEIWRCKNQIKADACRCRSWSWAMVPELFGATFKCQKSHKSQIRGWCQGWCSSWWCLGELDLRWRGELVPLLWENLFVASYKRGVCCCVMFCDTVDGQNPAPPRMMIIPLF